MPFNQRCEHFIKDYDSGHERRAGKMSRQTGMIGANHTANLKCHPELLLLDGIRQSSGLLAPAVQECFPTNQIVRNTARTH